MLISSSFLEGYRIGLERPMQRDRYSLIGSRLLCRKGTRMGTQNYETAFVLILQRRDRQCLKKPKKQAQA